MTHISKLKGCKTIEDALLLLVSSGLVKDVEMSKEAIANHLSGISGKENVLILMDGFCGYDIVEKVCDNISYNSDESIPVAFKAFEHCLINR